MKFLVFLGIITTVAAFHQECSLQSCTQHQPYVVDEVLNHPFSTSISVIIQFPVYLLQLIARNLNWVVL